MDPRIPDNWPNKNRSRQIKSAGITWHVQIAGADDHRPPSRIDASEPPRQPFVPKNAPHSSSSSASPDRPVVLLLHGTGGSTHEWADVLPALADHAIVVAPDLPGHAFTYIEGDQSGQPPAPPAHAGRDPMTLPGMAAAVAELMRGLRYTPSVIAGHSAGAAVALRMVLDGLAQPRALVGFNPALIPPPDIWVDVLAPLAGLMMESSWLSRGAAWASRLGGVTESMLSSSGARLTAEQLAHYEQLFADPRHCAGALTMMSRWNLPALVRDAAGLTTPFLAWAGARDTWVPPAALTRQLAGLPHTTLEVVPEVGHLLPEEAPTVALRALHQALALPRATRSTDPPRV